MNSDTHSELNVHAGKLGVLPDQPGGDFDGATGNDIYIPIY
jgi:hypothetical protein